MACHRMPSLFDLPFGTIGLEGCRMGSSSNTFSKVAGLSQVHLPFIGSPFQFAVGWYKFVKSMYGKLWVPLGALKGGPRGPKWVPKWGFWGE